MWRQFFTLMLVASVQDYFCYVYILNNSLDRLKPLQGAVILCWFWRPLWTKSELKTLKDLDLLLSAKHIFCFLCYFNHSCVNIKL